MIFKTYVRKLLVKSSGSKEAIVPVIVSCYCWIPLRKSSETGENSVTPRHNDWERSCNRLKGHSTVAVLSDPPPICRLNCWGGGGVTVTTVNRIFYPEPSQDLENVIFEKFHKVQKVSRDIVVRMGVKKWCISWKFMHFDLNYQSEVKILNLSTFRELTSF